MKGYSRVLVFCLACMILIFCVPGAVFAENGIALYIDGILQELKQPCLLDDNGEVYIPMEEVFFKMGVYMKWDERAGCYIGEGNNGEIRITPDSDVAEVDWVPIELPGKVQTVNGVLMIPLYLVEDALRTDPATYDEKQNRIDIKFPDIHYQARRDVDYERIMASLPEGEVIFGGDDMYNVHYDSSSSYTEYAKFNEVKVEGMPFDKALQIETLPLPNRQVPAASYNIQQDVYVYGGDFEAGDVGMMTLWARATKITDESGVAKMRPAYEQVGYWQKATEAEISIGPEWQKYYLPLDSGVYTLKAGESHVTYSVGFKPQVIEVADITIVNYHQDVDFNTFFPDKFKPYKGMEDDHLWKKHAWKRVEKYRKNDMIVRVCDREGNPIEGAEIKVDMKENEFMMGLAIIFNEILDLGDEDSKQVQIKKDVLNQFNTVIDGLEMKFFEGRDSMQRPQRMTQAVFDMGKRSRGHCLSWGGMDSAKLSNGFDSWSYEDKCDYYRWSQLGEAWMFRDTVVEWDVLNEPHDSADWRNKYGTGFYSELFQKVKAIDPKAKLLVNETGMEGHPDRNHKMRAPGFLTIVNPMREKERAPIDGIGIQGHCTSYYYPMGFYHEIDTLTQDYDFVTITEYDFYNADMTYAKNHLYDTFLATISHPKTNGFVIWGYQDTNHWRGVGPFYDRQWNKKDTYDTWKYMYNELYQTHENVMTGKDGNATVRGYRGTYDVTVTVGGISKTVEFMLTDSDDTLRDNYIDVVVDGANITATTPNPYEIYRKRNLDYANHEAAAADYLAKGADKWIGIYNHRNAAGERLPMTTDGLQNTYYYVEGDSYAEYELVKKAKTGYVSVDFRAPRGEVYQYEILASKDGKDWTSIYQGSSDQKITADFHDAMFIRIQSKGNEYMGISEVDIHAEEV